MAQIAILHPGEMGAAVGGALRAVGHDVYWRPDGRGPATRRRAADTDLLERGSLAGCEIVISICPPAAAISTAASIGKFDGIYIDANAISPDTARQVAQLVGDRGADYVDGALIGPPPSLDRAGETHFYLSGEGAREIADTFGDTWFQSRVIDQPPFAASSLKMVFATGTKITTAVALAARAAAAALGVEQHLADEWADSRPGLEQRYQAGLAAAAAKGWRWDDEMRQIAQTFAAAGQPEGFGLAAAEIFGSWPRPAAES